MSCGFFWGRGFERRLAEGSPPARSSAEHMAQNSSFSQTCGITHSCVPRCGAWRRPGALLATASGDWPTPICYT
jgi:hypothetical protein